MEPSNGGSSFINHVKEEWKKLNVTPLLLAKLIAGGVVAIVVLAFAFQLISATMGGVRNSFHATSIAPSMPQGISVGGYPAKYSYGRGDYYEEVAMDMAVAAPAMEYGYGKGGGGSAGVALSARNIVNSMPAPNPGAVGDGENLEVAQYSASIETRKLKETCESIIALKPRADIVFENSYTSDTSCNYTFKVRHDKVTEVLDFIKGLKPKDLSENTFTIKEQVQDYTSAEEVLLKKRESIDETLSKAVAAYNEVTVLATRSQNADALASIINSKIAIIERLTQSRVEINDQLDRLARAKAQQLDRVDYTYFHVNVSELKFIDWKQLCDSWKYAVRNFVFELNTVAQSITLRFVLVLASVLEWALYALVALFVLKYGWRAAKRLWEA